MPIQQTLEHLAHVLEEVGPIGNRKRVGCAATVALGIRARAVAGNHLDAWMRLQPLLHHLRGAFGNQVNRLMGFQVDQDCPIHLTFAKRNVVDTQVAGRRSQHSRRMTGKAEECISADGHTLAACQTSAWFTANFQPQISLLKQHAGCTSGTGKRQSRHGLTEGFARAEPIVAEEALDVEVEVNGNVGQGKIGQDALVATMHTIGVAPTTGADCARSSGMDVDGHALWQKLGVAEAEQRSRWEKERFAHG